MKNVFAINEKNNKLDGEELITRRLSPELLQQRNEKNKTLEDYEEKSSPSKVSGALKVALYLIALILLMVALSLLKELSFKEFLKKDWYLALIIVLDFVGIFVLVLLDKKKANKVSESEEVKSFIDEINDLGEMCQKDLKVPDETTSVDVLTCVYKLVNGLKKPVNKYMDYVAIASDIYVQNNSLCFTDYETVLEVPLEEIKIKKQEGKMTCVGWNKKEPFNKGEYKKYKIKTNNMGIFIYKTWYTLEFNTLGSDYQILIPIYDIENVLKVTNKVLDEVEEKAV